MASRLQDVVLRGTAASKPLATAVAPGTQYFSTDTQVTERSNGTVWESYSAVGVTPPAAHAPSHSSGGTDPVTVTALAGYPGTTSTFLRGDHTFSALPTAAPRTGAIEFVIDGGGAVIATGSKPPLEIPAACTITAVTLFANVAGSAVLDVWKAAYVNYPPVVANTITASAKPTLTAAQKSRDTVLTGWATALAAGDIIVVNVDSAAVLTRLTVSLTISVP